MAGSDTAFKNAARPTELDDGRIDVEPSPAGNKKRTSAECGGHQVHRRAEKRHRMLPAEDAKNGGGGTPAPSRKDEAPASSSRERRPVDDGGGKLLGDAIRSYGGGFEIKPRISKPKPNPRSKKRKDLGGPPFWCGMGRDGQATSSAGSDLASSSFHNLCGGVISAALHATLAAAVPERVYGKMLAACDQNSHQSRMQMSCKSWLRANRGAFPLDAFLTEPERKKARGGEGLKVKAYDRRGVAYKITVKYLHSNRSYRLTKEWGKFLKGNGLVVDVVPGPRDVVMDLWMFRTLAGEVGMVVMHYFKGDAPHADAAFDNDGAMAAGADEKRQLDDAAVNEEAAAATSPPEIGCGGKDGEEEQAGGAASAELQASSADADGTKTEEKVACGAALTTEAAAQSSLSVEEEVAAAEGKEASSAPMTEAAAQPSDAVGAAETVGKEATRPSTPVAGGAAKKASGLSMRFGLSEYEVSAAHALLMLSTDYGACVTST